MILLSIRSVLSPESFLLPKLEEEKMRACFLGQNICNLGYGVATLLMPRLLTDELAPEEPKSKKYISLAESGGVGGTSIESPPVANSSRPEA
jgi:hypothetical protein